LKATTGTADIVFTHQQS